VNERDVDVDQLFSWRNSKNKREKINIGLSGFLAWARVSKKRTNVCSEGRATEK
jgi:hypothetical protein